MLISHKYLIKQMESLNVEIPSNPTEAVDEIIIRILRICGKHQRYIGVPRCNRITSEILNEIKKSTSLLFLNISHTGITDITALSYCQSLKGLSIAGLKCHSYDCLGNLVGLETLNLQGTLITNTNAISGLRSLRSLDIGSTLVQCKTDLSSLTRLEELYIDSTPQEYLTNFETFSSLQLLMLINVGDSSLHDTGAKLSMILPVTTYIEMTPRKTLFIDAIINNDIITVKDYIYNGQEVNIRIGDWAMDLFVNTWKDRCQTSTLFFDCNHPDETMRPTPVHIALFFNSQESLECLIKAQAIVNHAVWFGAVDLANNEGFKSTLVQSTKLQVVEKPTRMRNALELVKRCFDDNIHRVTDKMWERRIRDWKQLCQINMNKLIAILYNEVYVEPQITTDTAADGDVAASTIDIRAQTPSDINLQIPPSREKGADTKGLTGCEPTDDKGVKEEKKSDQNDIAIDTLTTNIAEKKESDDDMVVNQSTEDGSEYVMEAKTAVDISWYSSSLKELAEYEPMISKLTAPRIKRIAGTKKSFSYLGPKSYWMERKVQLIAERERKAEALIATESQLNTNKRKPLTRAERKALFLEQVKIDREKIE